MQMVSILHHGYTGTDTTPNTGSSYILTFIHFTSYREQIHFKEEHKPKLWQTFIFIARTLFIPLPKKGFVI